MTWIVGILCFFIGFLIGLETEVTWTGGSDD
jgi:hypothetical protein